MRRSLIEEMKGENKYPEKKRLLDISCSALCGSVAEFHVSFSHKTTALALCGRCKDAIDPEHRYQYISIESAESAGEKEDEEEPEKK